MDADLHGVASGHSNPLSATSRVESGFPSETAQRTRDMANLALTFTSEACNLARELDRRTGRKSRALATAVQEAATAAQHGESHLLLGNEREAYQWALASMATAATALAEAKAALVEADGRLRQSDPSPGPDASIPKER